MTGPRLRIPRKKKSEFFPGLEDEIAASRSRVDRISQETDYLNDAGVGGAAEPQRDSTAQAILRAIMAGLGNVDQRQEGVAGAVGSVAAGYNSAQRATDVRGNTEWEQGQTTARNAANIYNQNQRNRDMGRRTDLYERDVDSRIEDRKKPAVPKTPPRTPMTPYERLESEDQFWQENPEYPNPLMNPRGGRGAEGGLDTGHRWILDAAMKWLNTDAGYKKSIDEAIAHVMQMYDAVVGGGAESPAGGGFIDGRPIPPASGGAKGSPGPDPSFGNQPGQADPDPGFGNQPGQRDPGAGMTPQLQGYVGGGPKNPLMPPLDGGGANRAPNAGGSQAITHLPEDEPFVKRGVGPYDVSEANSEAAIELQLMQVIWDEEAAILRRQSPGIDPETALGPRPTR